MHLYVHVAHTRIHTPISLKDTHRYKCASCKDYEYTHPCIAGHVNTYSLCVYIHKHTTTRTRKSGVYFKFYLNYFINFQSLTIFTVNWKLLIIISSNFNTTKLMHFLTLVEVSVKFKQVFLWFENLLQLFFF